MKVPLFTGSSVAIVTPMHTDGTINYDKLEELIEIQIESGTAAITVCGTTGEAATLSDLEQQKIISCAVERVSGRIPVIAGAGSNDTAHAKRLCKQAEKCGADGLLVVTPYYNKCSRGGLVRHYTEIAEQSKIPLILYNVPSRTGVSVPVDVCKELSKHPNINGMKEASGNLELLLRLREACRDDLHMWCGNDGQIVPYMSLGAKGVISVMANVIPKETAHLTELCLCGEFSQATAMQIRFAPLIDGLFCEVNPIPIKTAMNLCGMDVGPLRLPLCEMDAAAEVRLKEMLCTFGVYQ